MDCNRREMLAAVSVTGLVGLSGCLNRGSVAVRGLREVFSEEDTEEEVSVTDSLPSYNESTEGIDGNQSAPESLTEIVRRQYAIETEREIREGSYIYWEIEELEEPDEGSLTLEYEVLVRSGPKVNVIFMDREELTPYLNNERHFYYEDISEIETVWANESAEISAQEYAFVLENTSNQSEAKVDVSLEVH